MNWRTGINPLPVVFLCVAPMASAAVDRPHRGSQHRRSPPRECGQDSPYLRIVRLTSHTLDTHRGCFGRRRDRIPALDTDDQPQRAVHDPDRPLIHRRDQIPGAMAPRHAHAHHRRKIVESGSDSSWAEGLQAAPDDIRQRPDRVRHCGSPITGERKYVYYYCTQYHKGDHPCTRLTGNELDARMLAIFDTRRVEDARFRDLFREQLRQATNWDQDSAIPEVAQLQKELASLRHQQDRLLNILEIVCLNWKLDGVSLVPEWRKPFDLLAEGLQKKDSRENKTSFELFLGPFSAWKQAHWNLAQSCNS